ncbi:DUF222 domain-containing protein [uncultured Jatrophihabitans sp.]|uniref:HNH endonuclease signature motif containing protein n=1 Tax=uncultured Jatrophihabitans sp. TaxID=1610747 RepID=UPI0035CA6BB5
MAGLRAGADALLSCDLEALSSLELTGLLAEVEVQRRRLAAVDQRLVGAVHKRGVAGEYARGSSVDLLITLLRVAPGEAKARVEQALDMGPRHSLTGEPLGPVFPLVAAAQAAGEISAAHARAVTTSVYAIPPALATEAAPVAEQLLVKASRHCEPGLVARTGRELLARLNPDGVEPDDREAERRRDVTLRRRAGRNLLTGELTDANAAAWQAIIDALSASQAALDGQRDDRTAGQRRHDALLDAGLRLLHTGTLPAAGGTPVTVTVTMSAAQLTEATGYARTAHGELISADRLLDLAAEADIIPVVCNDAGGVLAYGRAIRTATCAQRRALTARDGGCCFPGCTRPASWCQAHHVIAWQHGGATDLNNLCLLCPYHHREFERRGWTVEILDGMPQWIPPPWLDPERRPVRNTVHHLADIDFGVVAA